MKPENAGDLKVVLDTNVYVSAFTRLEKPLFQIWLKAVRRQYELLVSPAIVTEVARVLREDFSWEEVKIIRQLKLIAKVGKIIIPEASLNDFSRPAD